MNCVMSLVGGGCSVDRCSSWLLKVVDMVGGSVDRCQVVWLVCMGVGGEQCQVV